jgi:hypothetical protein
MTYYALRLMALPGRLQGVKPVPAPVSRATEG